MADHKELARQCNHLAGVIDMGEAVQFSMQRATTLLRACAAELEASALPQPCQHVYGRASTDEMPHCIHCGVVLLIRRLDAPQPTPDAGSVQQRAKEWAGRMRTRMVHETSMGAMDVLRFSRHQCDELIALLDECAAMLPQSDDIPKGETWH